MVALLGNMEGGSFTRDFESWMKEGSGNGASLSEGNLERRLHYWELHRIS